MSHSQHVKKLIMQNARDMNDFVRAPKRLARKKPLVAGYPNNDNYSVGLPYYHEM